MVKRAKRGPLFAKAPVPIKKIQAVIEQHKRSVKKGEIFIATTEQQLREKLRRINSPMIVSEAWTESAAPGGTINYSVSIVNPDEVAVTQLFAHVFVGSGSVVSDEGMFLLNVDSRFPRLTKPGGLGRTLAPGASTRLDFAIPIRSTIVPGSYIGNTALLRLELLSIGGALFDRGSFVFTIE